MDLYALECMRQSSECFPPNGLTQLVKLVTDVMFRRFSIDNTIFLCFVSYVCNVANVKSLQVF